jgi:hypothetical protein
MVNNGTRFLLSLSWSVLLGCEGDRQTEGATGGEPCLLGVELSVKQSPAFPGCYPCFDCLPGFCLIRDLLAEPPRPAASQHNTVSPVVCKNRFLHEAPSVQVQRKECIPKPNALKRSWGVGRIPKTASLTDEVKSRHFTLTFTVIAVSRFHFHIDMLFVIFNYRTNINKDKTKMR